MIVQKEDVTACDISSHLLINTKKGLFPLIIMLININFAHFLMIPE